MLFEELFEELKKGLNNPKIIKTVHFKKISYSTYHH